MKKINWKILEIFNYANFKLVNKYQMYLGWDDIKWYHDYDDIMALESGLDYLKESNYTFKFSRMGEDFDDIEEIYNDGKRDIKENYYIDFPYLERFYNDDKIKNNLCMQDKLNNKIREQKRQKSML